MGCPLRTIVTVLTALWPRPCISFVIFRFWKFLIHIIPLSLPSSSSNGTTTLSCVFACSSVVEHSPQEGYTQRRCQRNVKHPTWRRTSDLERSNFRQKRPPASEATLANPAAEGGTMGEIWSRILPKVATSTSLLGFFYMPLKHGTDGFTSPPKEGVLRIFSPEKSDGFCWVWTRELEYQRPARYL
jgi:hypothetical protein